MGQISPYDHLTGFSEEGKILIEEGWAQKGKKVRVTRRAHYAKAHYYSHMTISSFFSAEQEARIVQKMSSNRRYFW